MSGPNVSNLACSLLSSVEDEQVRNNREQRLLKENQIADDKLLVKLQEAKMTEKKVFLFRQIRVRVNFLNGSIQIRTMLTERRFMV